MAQDLFATLKGRRHTFQFRMDFVNFGNLLNSDWGVGQRLVSNSPLIVPSAAQGGASTRRAARSTACDSSTTS